MPTISIIIPAYNVADCLPKALDSALAQTHADFELIVVNDGSTDATGAVCDAYANADARVSVIHQQNAGAPAARNAAIERATGKYLYFMDGDDWAEPEMLGDMYARIEETGADLLITGYYIDTHHGKSGCAREVKSHPDALYTDAQAFRHAATALFDENLLYTPWNKLYRASRVHALGIRFRPTKWDDFPFNIDYIRDVSRVAVDARAYYHFTRGLRDTETSTYFAGMFEKREEEHRALIDLYAHWGLAGDAEAEEFLARRYIERVLGVLENVVCRDSPLSGREKRAEMARILCSEHVGWSLARAKPRGLHTGVLMRVLRAGRILPIYAMSGAISAVKSHCPRAFTAFKAGR
ncbi:MAG: glycosyltransferase family 2 protein [Christensenellales bacterium]